MVAPGWPLECRLVGESESHGLLPSACACLCHSAAFCSLAALPSLCTSDRACQLAWITSRPCLGAYLGNPSHPSSLRSSGTSPRGHSGMPGTDGGARCPSPVPKELSAHPRDIIPYPRGCPVPDVGLWLHLSPGPWRCDWCSRKGMESLI